MVVMGLSAGWSQPIQTLEFVECAQGWVVDAMVEHGGNEIVPSETRGIAVELGRGIRRFGGSDAQSVDIRISAF